MAVLEREKIINSLKKKGFKEKQITDRLYFMYVNLKGGQTGITTKLSLGSGHKDISDMLISCMARQCKVNKKDFLNL